ncbi:putative type I restriction enzyme modification protein [Halobacteriovorax marinus SJ]|uniref:site-specific DNA-methyltransferase (adenine-specific) n=1 Tax=Halobacteriovorax marinus (strain ATCC BAA-682 / DSM 15412 / SJ) TaxID=862908 RepID=E1X5X3_HALMS|nr:type I restriction-modification system subunit M [Halobacteriovorax marinus]CBW25690.1 putative type I restriction enzyme modification protein [Halobacteriovorax marinus SJ]
MTQKVTQAEINKILWDACDTFRGVVDAGEYKNYILTMLFIKYLSDTYEEKYEAYSEQFKGNETRIKRALEKENFVLPDGCHFNDIYKQKEEKNIGEIIDVALEKIENANKEKLENVFRNVSFNSEANLGKTKSRNARLKHLLDDFNSPKLNMRKSHIGNMDVIGNAYEYLIANFAAGAGKKAGEFYTPSEVSQLLAMLVKPEKGSRIYDPTCGSGSLLIRCAEQLTKNGINDFQIYGQEITGATWALAKMNMFLHGFDRSVIENGDTIRNPIHLENDELMTFDVVVANPPFSLDKWGIDEAKSDSYGRFNYGIPPKSYGELAFVQHMVASLNENGRCAVVLPHGVLFRGSAEKRIREGLINDDLLEAVIGLPSGLFFGTGIPASIMVFNKKKSADRKDKVLFINGDLEYQEGKNQNKLRDQDINHIVANYVEFKTEGLYRHEDKHYSRVVELDEIKENDYNLNIRRYADTSAPPEIFDVKAILNGGIPKYEIEDGYIQDIIDGFDVSVVFDERDKEYYVFKNEIDSKEKIREVMGDVDQAIISQVERWWEKYSTALRGIESQCVEAEKEMNSFLKELSYE